MMRPIHRASEADRAAIEALVQQILDLKSADPAADVSELEAEIDRRVEFLYFHQDGAPAPENPARRTMIG